MQYCQLNQLLGNVDLHLLDQILKGRYQTNMRLLDAGCGEGRNLPYLVRNDIEVWGVDRDPVALRFLRAQGKSWGAAFDPEKFMVGELTQLHFPPMSFDAILCCAVLHFARDEQHFFSMIDELLRVLKPAGSLFIRMKADSSVGADLRASRGQEELLNEYTFLLTQERLDRLLQHYPLRWLEPQRIEWVAGQGVRSTLILEKH